jgi:hypothetical protein
MIKSKMYRYLGRNGSITTPIKLEEIAPIPMLQLKAATGYILTDGVRRVYSVVIFEDELENWSEVKDDGQK